MIWLLLLLLVVFVETDQDKNYSDEITALEFIRILNTQTARWSNLVTKTDWEYETNLTTFNLHKKLNTTVKYMAWQKKMWKEVNKYRWDDFKDPLLKRQFKKFSVLGMAALPDDKRSRLDEVVAEMQKIYSTTKLREWRHHRSPEEHLPSAPEKSYIQLNPDLISIFSSDRNKSCELQYYWQGWHDTVGRKVKSLFEEYVELTNEAAKLNNFTDNAAYWIDEFEMENFEDEVHKLYLQVRQPYQQLHAFVRRKLREHYNTDEQRLIKEDGLLPAHILGNVWAQQWDAIYQITVPFPGKGSVDITPAMKAQNYTPTKMAELTEQFFTSLNLSAMTETFWKKSIFEKPRDREMICHASAWDFYNADDFRIKMCTTVSLDDLKTIHHEMGHIQYFQQYKNQPFVFRNGANSGFHEAVGDTLALSVSTAKHLMKIGLLDKKTHEANRESEINYLYLMALEKLAFLPYAYVLDLWRWEVFRGKIFSKDYNCRFWELRQKIQGIFPPVSRSEDDFDAGAKYHVIADVPYIRYFVSYIIQFQLHKALCIKAGQYGSPDNPASKPLHHCDIYQSIAAGKNLSEMLRLGSSQHWKDALQIVTDQREMDAGPLLEYFEPLLEYLEEENFRNNEKVGWAKNKDAVKFCKKDFKGSKKGKNSAVKDKCNYVIADERTDKKIPKEDIQ